jgi:hypothetical protein
MAFVSLVTLETYVDENEWDSGMDNLWKTWIVSILKIKRNLAFSNLGVWMEKGRSNNRAAYSSPFFVLHHLYTLILPWQDQTMEEC